MAEPMPRYGLQPLSRPAAVVIPDRPLAPLLLSPLLRDALRWLARKGYPEEVCGLLVGRQGAAGTRVQRVTQTRNLAGDQRADRFTLDPDGFLAAEELARADGLEVVGIWHTHPDRPARPSETDLQAAWHGYSYLILSVTLDGVGALRSWHLGDRAFIEQEITEVRP